MSVSRHIETCLGMTIGVLIQENKIQQAIDVHAEFQENLRFVKKMRAAADEWLTDPNNSEKFTLAPRSDEVDIVYYVQGERGPKAVTENLQALIARLEENGYDHPSPFVKTVDLRDHALKIIDRVDMTVDKFAKIGGIYQQDRPNEHYRDMYQGLAGRVDELEQNSPDKSPKEIARLIREEGFGPAGYIMGTAHLLTQGKITPQEWLEIQELPGDQ